MCKCSIDDCERTTVGRGFCQLHYRRFMSTGDPMQTKQHNQSYSTEYNVWKMMKQRCFNPKHSSYVRYGARGVTVCASWADSFEVFLSDMGPRPENTTLDRVDNNGSYGPGNCRWATVEEQTRNKRNNRLLTIYGKTMTAVEWYQVVSHELNYQTFRKRLFKNWPDKEAVFGRAVKYSYLGVG